MATPEVLQGTYIAQPKQSCATSHYKTRVGSLPPPTMVYFTLADTLYCTFGLHIHSTSNTTATISTNTTEITTPNMMGWESGWLCVIVTTGPLVGVSERVVYTQVSTLKFHTTTLQLRCAYYSLTCVMKQLKVLHIPLKLSKSKHLCKNIVILKFLLV